MNETTKHGGRRVVMVGLGLAMTTSTFGALDANAACNRDDIDYYLSKGFTAEQITAICSGNERKEPATNETSPAAAGIEQPVPTPLQTANPPNQQSSILKESINGYDIEITSTTLAFTRKNCIEYGPENIYGFRSEVCPEVRYTFTLAGLSIVKLNRKYGFFGPVSGMVLSNRAESQILNGIEKLDESGFEEVSKVINNREALTIPLQDGVPFERVRPAFTELTR